SMSTPRACRWTGMPSATVVTPMPTHACSPHGQSHPEGPSSNRPAVRSPHERVGPPLGRPPPVLGWSGRDRGLTSRLDLDLARLCLLRHWNAQFQHAGVVGRLDVVEVEVV